MTTDFKELIHLPVWLRRPADVAEGSHQLTLLARAVGAVFNGILTRVYAIRRQWIISLASGRFLDEHGADRRVYRAVGETDEPYRLRVLAGAPARIPGETRRGMETALDTLGLINYEIEPVWKTDSGRWAEFDVWFGDAENQTLTDAQIQARIDAAKSPSQKGNVVRTIGVGFGSWFGAYFGGVESDPANPTSGFGAAPFGTDFGS